MNIPKTFEEFVELTYIKYMYILPKKLTDLHRKRALEKGGFLYNGYYYEKGGKIYRSFMNGTRTLLFQDLSIKQMFVFIENLENKNFLEEEK